LRIFPAYLAVVALYFGFASIREASRIQPLWQFLIFTENLFIDYSSDKAFSHVWSLCVEEHFYLLFPVAAWVMLVRPSVGKTSAALSLLVIGGALIRFWIWRHNFASAFEVTTGATRPGYRYFEQLYYPTYTRLDGLLVGVLLGGGPGVPSDVVASSRSRSRFDWFCDHCFGGHHRSPVQGSVWFDRDGFWLSGPVCGARQRRGFGGDATDQVPFFGFGDYLRRVNFLQPVLEPQAVFQRGE
jgi:hypothetical protein